MVPNIANINLMGHKPLGQNNDTILMKELIRKRVASMSKEELMRSGIKNIDNADMDLSSYQPDFFVTTTQAEHTWQPMEKINLNTSYHKRKNEFSIYVDASFQGGVFKMPLIDPPKSVSDEFFETQKQRNIIQ